MSMGFDCLFKEKTTFLLGFYEKSLRVNLMLHIIELRLDETSS